MKDLKITCPHCQNMIDVEETLAHQVQHQFDQDFLKKKKQLENEFAAKFADIENKQEQLDQLVETKLKEKEASLESKLKKKILEDWNEEKRSFEEQLQEKSIKIKTFQNEQLELLKQKNALEEKANGLELEVQKRMGEERKVMEEKIRIAEHEKSFMKIKEKEDLVEALKKELENVQRRAQQGSMQSQGEVQEVALAEMLTNKYIFDAIEDVKTGANGADVIQTVCNMQLQASGVIVYESKRTKSFSDKWIDKLKDDMKTHKADVGIIVTETMPEDMPKFGLRNGIWVCSFGEVEGLSAVLRESLLQISKAKQSQVGKGEKMELLYDFLCSNEFKLQIESIVNGFSKLKIDLDKEKRSMQRIWKEREKQIEVVLTSTVEMYGSIKGIAGNAIGTVKALELPEEIANEEV